MPRDLQLPEDNLLLGLARELSYLESRHNFNLHFCAAIASG